MASGNDSMAYRLTLIEDRVKTFEKTNKALSKRRKAKRICIQDGGTCIGDIAEVLIAEKEEKKSKQQKMSSEEDDTEARPAIQRRYSNCGKTGHNIRTCQEVEETSDESSHIASD
jgi:hypothetical protein